MSTTEDALRDALADAVPELEIVSFDAVASRARRRRALGVSVAAAATGVAVLALATIIGLADGGNSNTATTSTTSPTPSVGGGPVFADAPTAPPAAQRSLSVCRVPNQPDANGSPGAPPVTVDSNPLSVTAVWIPTMNQQSCRAEQNVASQAVANQLVAAIQTARSFPGGILHCPADVGSAVDLYFKYADRRDELVTVTLTGCPAVGAPGRGRLAASSTLMQLLDSIAPDPWKSG